MTEKEITMEDLDESAKQTDEQLDLMAWKVDDKNGLVLPVDGQDMCVMHLLKSVTEQLIGCLPQDKHILATSLVARSLQVRADYRALRRELLEVQALQRELSARLRAQLRVVHGRFARLRQRLQQADRLQR